MKKTCQFMPRCNRVATHQCLASDGTKVGKVCALHVKDMRKLCRVVKLKKGK